MKSSQIRDRHKKPNTPCYVCEKHESVTIWHHLIPVGHIAKNIQDYMDDEIFLEEGNTLYCLCPTCHSYIHILYKCENKEAAYKQLFESTKILSNFSNEETWRLLEINSKFREATE